MSEKRFEVVLNEFDEVEYIIDKEMMEDRDFAEFLDFVEGLAQTIKTQDMIIREQELLISKQGNELTAIKKWGVDYDK